MKTITVPDVIVAKIKPLLEKAGFNLEATFTMRFIGGIVTFTQPDLKHVKIQKLSLGKDFIQREEVAYGEENSNNIIGPRD